MKFPEWLKVYGDTSYRGDCPTEQMEQVTFFAQLRKNYPEVGKTAIHIRNEGKRSWGQAQWQKAEGMVNGAPDIVIPAKNTFCCELKRLDHTKSKWQKGQLEYLEIAHQHGATVCIALGWKSAYSAFETWWHHVIS